MKSHLLAAMSVIAVATFALPANAAMPEAELALMPKTADVTLLNDGGKYVAIDMKHIDKGEKCRIDQDAIVVRLGDGATPGTARVRTVMPQVSSGGCPFMTEFELPADQYTAARHAFVEQKEAADKKLADITKKLGEKWDELFGTSKPKPKTESL